MALTQEQLQFFSEQGFLVVPGFVAEEACAALRARAAQLIEAAERDSMPGRVAAAAQGREEAVADLHYLQSAWKCSVFHEVMRPLRTRLHVRTRSCMRAHAHARLHARTHVLNSLAS